MRTPCRNVKRYVPPAVVPFTRTTLGMFRSRERLVEFPNEGFELPVRQIVDAGGGGPAPACRKLTAEIIGPARAVRRDSHAHDVTAGGIRDEHRVALIGMTPDDVIGHDPGDSPRPGRVRQNVDPETRTGRRRLEIRGFGHVRRITVAKRS